MYCDLGGPFLQSAFPHAFLFSSVSPHLHLYITVGVFKVH